MCVQVENREAEIERLSAMLKGGRPPEALASEGARASNERMVAHLNIQVCALSLSLSLRRFENSTVCLCVG